MFQGRYQKELMREPPPERSFLQVFPWRNIRRALMLVLVIFAIVAIKRSTGSLLSRIGDLWGPARGTASAPTPTDGIRIKLGPGLAPPNPAPARLTPSDRP